MRSRLKTNIKKQNTRMLAGIIIIVLIVIFFGIKFLIGFSVILEKFKGQKNDLPTTNNLNYISPPIINDMHSATNSANVTITGYSTAENSSILLFVNNENVDKQETNKDNSFVFNNIQLKSGENEIKAKAIDDSSNTESAFSQSIKIMYTSKQPLLDVTYPNDGQTVKKESSPIRITGKTDPNAKVTINDFWAISKDDGSFYYLFNLKDGENDIKITSTDEAGNKITKEIKIKTE